MRDNQQQRQDKQLQGIALESVLEKRRLDQALNAKEFAVCAGVALYNKDGIYRIVILSKPFRELLFDHIESIRESNRYLGDGFVKINNVSELRQWMT
jgi:hypothetical protein